MKLEKINLGYTKVEYKPAICLKCGDNELTCNHYNDFIELNLIAKCEFNATLGIYHKDDKKVVVGIKGENEFHVLSLVKMVDKLWKYKEYDNKWNIGFVFGNWQYFLDEFIKV